MDTITITPNIPGANRKSLTFTIIRSIAPWEKEALLDPSGTTYECTRVRGSFILSYNPGAESFKVGAGQSFPTPVPLNANPTNMPVTTDVALRRFLEQPRFQIKVQSNGVTWLESPGFGPNGVLACDARTGPFLKFDSIQQIAGERLWQVHCQIETYINESPKVRGTSFPPLMLSNRWYAMDDTNWQHLRTRIYQGVCTVRGDVLQAQTLVAGGNSQKYVDYFRDQFAAFSIPVGFQRQQVKVTATPDGNTAHYTVVDVEQLFNKSQNCPAVRLDVADTSMMWTGTALNALRQAGGVVGLGARAVAIGAYGIDAALSLNVNPSGAAAIGLTLSTVEMVTNAVLANLPKGYRNIIVRCWGNQRQNRLALVNYAMAVAFTRMGVPALLTTSSKQIVLSQDSENFVQVNYTVNWGLDTIAGALGNVAAIGFGGAELIAQALGGGQQAQATGIFNEAVSGSPNTTVDAPGVGNVSHTQAQLLVNPPFPSDSGTRGTAASAPSSVVLQMLITQALESFDQQPASVP